MYKTFWQVRSATCYICCCQDNGIAKNEKTQLTTRKLTAKHSFYYDLVTLCVERRLRKYNRCEAETLYTVQTEAQWVQLTIGTAHVGTVQREAEARWVQSTIGTAHVRTVQRESEARWVQSTIGTAHVRTVQRESEARRVQSTIGTAHVRTVQREAEARWVQSTIGTAHVGTGL